MKTPLKSLACFLALCLSFPAFAGTIVEYRAQMEQAIKDIME
jgi:hypothetical protein